MDVHNKIQQFGKHKFEFTNIFGLSISPYAHPIFGFDIVKFDEDIKVPDNISCKNHINNKYGKAAVELIEKLMKI